MSKQDELGRILWRTNPKLAAQFFPHLKPVVALGLTPTSRAVQRGVRKPNQSFFIDGIEFGCLRPVVEDVYLFPSWEVWKRVERYCHLKGSLRRSTNRQITTDEGVVPLTDRGYKEAHYAPIEDIRAGLCITAPGKRRVEEIEGMFLESIN